MLALMLLRRELWHTLTGLVDSGYPVCFVGDFNVLTNASKKRGGHFNETSEVIEFHKFLMDNGLLDLGFIGPSYTWVNMQLGHRRIWERLDRGGMLIGMDKYVLDSSMLHLRGSHLTIVHYFCDCKVGILMDQNRFVSRESGGRLMACGRW